MSFPTITNTSVGEIRDFYEQLVRHSHALDTMGKLKEINGYIRLTLDNLPTIQVDLIRTDMTTIGKNETFSNL